jgi:hypothetical protein
MWWPGDGPRSLVLGEVSLVSLLDRFWIAAGIQYDTGLPFEFVGDPDTVLAQYGQQVLDRIARRRESTVERLRSIPFRLFTLSAQRKEANLRVTRNKRF